MWVKPQEVLVSGPLWTVERANPHFMLQRRKGRGTKGFSALFVGTWDAVMDTKPPSFRYDIFKLKSAKRKENKLRHGPFKSNIVSRVMLVKYVVSQLDMRRTT
jgi:hypothetical protein